MKLIQKIFHMRNYLEFVEDRSGHDKRYAIDSSKIQTKLKWKPNLHLKKHLKITINWYFNKFKSGGKYLLKFNLYFRIITFINKFINSKIIKTI